MNTLPRWKCHKIVEAAKIERIAYRSPSGREGARLVLSTAAAGDGERLMANLGEVVEATASMVYVEVNGRYIEKHEPAIGGYYVKYEDGYESYSPAATFEAGYSPVVE